MTCPRGVTVRGCTGPNDGAVKVRKARRIAADLARPTVTVRRWLRAVRGEHAEWLRAAAIDRLAQLDRDIISTLAPTGSRMGDALNAVAAAALAHRARLAPHVPIWDLVAAVTRWRLLPLPGD